MVSDKEEGFGDRVCFFSNGAADLITYPGGPRFPGEDRTEIAQPIFQRHQERALAAAINPLNGDQDHMPFLTASTGIRP
jgi:hypothetical protein